MILFTKINKTKNMIKPIYISSFTIVKTPINLEISCVYIIK